MKKQIFTLLILIGLVGFSSKLFAQSTPVAPYEGATHTYVVSGLTQNDSYTWGINTVGDYTTGGSFYTTSPALPANGTVGAAGTATLNVTWQTDAAAVGYYYIWIQITDELNCSTYRTLRVDPVPAVDYTVNFSVLALLAGDDTTIPASITGESGDDDINNICAPYFGEDLLSTSLTDGTTDGSTYVFFRVTRTSTVNAAWTFTPNGTDGLTWAISTDAAANFTTYTDATAQNIASGTNVIYIRATVPASTSTQDISLSIDAPEAFDAGHTEVDNETEGVNVATLEVLPLPTVDTAPFGSSF